MSNSSPNDSGHKLKKAASSGVNIVPQRKVTPLEGRWAELLVTQNKSSKSNFSTQDSGLINRNDEALQNNADDISPKQNQSNSGDMSSLPSEDQTNEFVRRASNLMNSINRAPNTPTPATPSRDGEQPRHSDSAQELLEEMRNARKNSKPLTGSDSSGSNSTNLNPYGSGSGKKLLGDADGDWPSDDFITTAFSNAAVAPPANGACIFRTHDVNTPFGSMRQPTVPQQTLSSNTKSGSAAIDGSPAVLKTTKILDQLSLADIPRYTSMADINKKPLHVEKNKQGSDDDVDSDTESVVCVPDERQENKVSDPSSASASYSPPDTMNAISQLAGRLQTTQSYYMPERQVTPLAGRWADLTSVLNAAKTNTSAEGAISTSMSMMTMEQHNSEKVLHNHAGNTDEDLVKSNASEKGTGPPKGRPPKQNHKQQQDKADAEGLLAVMRQALVSPDSQKGTDFSGDEPSSHGDGAADNDGHMACNLPANGMPACEQKNSDSSFTHQNVDPNVGSVTGFDGQQENISKNSQNHAYNCPPAYNLAGFNGCTDNVQTFNIMNWNNPNNNMNGDPNVNNNNMLMLLMMMNQQNNTPNMGNNSYHQQQNLMMSMMMQIMMMNNSDGGNSMNNNFNMNNNSNTNINVNNVNNVNNMNFNNNMNNNNFVMPANSMLNAHGQQALNNNMLNPMNGGNYVNHQNQNMNPSAAQWNNGRKGGNQNQNQHMAFTSPSLSEAVVKSTLLVTHMHYFKKGDATEQLSYKRKNTQGNPGNSRTTTVKGLSDFKPPPALPFELCRFVSNNHTVSVASTPKEFDLSNIGQYWSRYSISFDTASHQLIDNSRSASATDDQVREKQMHHYRKTNEDMNNYFGEVAISPHALLKMAMRWYARIEACQRHILTADEFRQQKKDAKNAHEVKNQHMLSLQQQYYCTVLPPVTPKDAGTVGINEDGQRKQNLLKMLLQLSLVVTNNQAEHWYYQAMMDVISGLTQRLMDNSKRYDEHLYRNLSAMITVVLNSEQNRLNNITANTITYPDTLSMMSQMTSMLVNGSCGASAEASTKQRTESENMYRLQRLYERQLEEQSGNGTPPYYPFTLCPIPSSEIIDGRDPRFLVWCHAVEQWWQALFFVD